VVAKAASHYAGATGGSASGKGKASFGKASGTGQSSTLDNEAVVSATGFADKWTISVPGLAKYTWLILTVRVRVTASLEAHGPSGSSGVSAQIYRNGGLAGYRNWGIRSDWYTPDVYSTVDQAAGMEFTVYADDPFMLAAVLKSHAGVASMNGQGSAKVATPTAGLVWDGVVQLRDYWSGQVYTDWTLVTESGRDWRTP
jgi:hypothetical protein